MKQTIKKFLLKIPKIIRDFLVEDLVKEHRDFNKEIRAINSEMKTIKKTIKNDEKDRLRHEILSFASSLRRKEKHTTQEYETIFHFHDKYESIVKSLREKNGFLDEEFEFIRECYQELKEGGL